MTHKQALSIGWIGTGVMGRWMATHLYNKGFTALSVYNRTLAKTEPLRDLGAHVWQSLGEVDPATDVVFTMLGHPSDVREVIGGPQGLIQTLRSGSVIVDLTTSSPELARTLASEAAAKGIALLDAPVSGGDVGARNGTLTVMMGGDRAAADRVSPLLQAFSKNVQYLGGAGAGQHTKMVNQILIAGGMIGVVEGLLYGYKAGLPLPQVIETVASGAAGSWSISNYGPRMLRRDFDPGFFVEHFVKDLGIALDEASKMNLSLPGLALAHSFYVAMKANGHGRKGTQALLLTFEQLNNVTLPNYAEQGV